MEFFKSYVHKWNRGNSVHTSNVQNVFPWESRCTAFTILTFSWLRAVHHSYWVLFAFWTVSCSANSSSERLFITSVVLHIVAFKHVVLHLYSHSCNTTLKFILLFIQRCIRDVEKNLYCLKLQTLSKIASCQMHNWLLGRVSTVQTNSKCACIISNCLVEMNSMVRTWGNCTKHDT